MAHADTDYAAVILTALHLPMKDVENLGNHMRRARRAHDQGNAEQEQFHLNKIREQLEMLLRERYLRIKDTGLALAVGAS